MALEYRVIGPPGTGKTTHMARQVSLAVAKHGKSKVMVTSFTKAAAKEIASRDLAGIDTEMVGTLHSMCFRALSNPVIAESKLKEWNELNAASPSWQVEGDRDLEDMGVGLYEDGGDLLSACNRYRGLMIPFEKWEHTPEGEFYAAWMRWKKESNYYDFTDLIERCIEERFIAPGNPSVIFVDEVQDMSPLELRLVRLWSLGADAGIMLAGDPDQSIYGFKGASPKAFYNPEIDKSMYRVLRDGYRVPEAVHRFSMNWIRRDSEHVDVEYDPRKGDAGLVADRRHDPSLCFQHSQQWVAKVDKLTKEYPSTTGAAVMIIASCGYMLNPVIRNLKLSGIPFHNPFRPSRGDWNPQRGGVERLRAYFRQQWTWRDLRMWTELIEAQGHLQHGARKVIDVNGKDPKRASTVVQSYELEGLLVPELLHSTGVPSCSVGERKLEALSNSLSSKGAKQVEYAIRLHQRGRLNDQPQVILGTIHSVKGAEANCVIVSPDLSPRGWDEWNSAGRNGIVRQFYVAATRARNALVLASPSSPRAVW